MEFGLSEEQRLLADSFNGFLEDKCPLDRVREVAETHGSHADDVLAGLVELGAAAVLVPEEHGGLNMSLLDAALIQEALGRHVAAIPFMGNVLASIALKHDGSPAQKETWLAEIADGSANFGIGLAELNGERDGAGLEASGDTLSGSTLFVIDGETATDFILADKEGALHLVSAKAEGLMRSSLKTIDRTRRVSELRLESVKSERLDEDKSAGETAAKMIAAGRVLLAADTLGAAERMIEKAVAYSLERKQFNRVIGSFQAVKHMCAEMAAKLEPCRALVWYAAHAQDEVPAEAAVMACHAKSHLSEVGQWVARTATEVHGGMGFTDLMGLHYWFKRIGLNRQLLGGPERVRREAAEMQWG